MSDEPGEATDHSSLPVDEAAGQRDAANAALPGWVPAFKGQRPPFQPGNQDGKATQFQPTHGAYSPRRVDPLAGEIVELLLADPSVPAHAKAAAYRLELWALARATAQAQLIEEWLADRAEAAGDTLGGLDGEGVRAAYLLLHRAEMRAASARNRLGLTPVSAARLGKNVAQAHVAQTDIALRMAQLAEMEAQGWVPPSNAPAVDDTSPEQPVSDHEETDDDAE